MLQDQLRLQASESEIDSLSSQLSSTYEELSLIYQISSGMKIDRRPSDFFSQTCLDLLEIMPWRAMGVALDRDHSAGQEPVIFGNVTLPTGKLDRLSAELLDILKNRKSTLLINGIAADGTFAWLAEHASHLLAVPMQRQDQTLGCLFAIDKIDSEFDSADSKLLNSIANEAAIYV